MSILGIFSLGGAGCSVVSFFSSLTHGGGLRSLGGMYIGLYDGTGPEGTFKRIPGVSGGLGILSGGIRIPI